MRPCGQLWREHECGQSKINDKEKIPCDAIVREWIEHARAEGREAVQDDVAGDAGCINGKEKCERRRCPPFASRPFCVSQEKSARQRGEYDSENRQTDERMSESAMVARNGERVVRKRVDEDVYIRKNGAKRRSENCNARYCRRSVLCLHRAVRGGIPVCEKCLADQRAGNTVCDWVHETCESDFTRGFRRRR